MSSRQPLYIPSDSWLRAATPYPPRWLPQSVRVLLANSLDINTATGRGFMLFAEELGYTPQDSQLFRDRVTREHHNSPTLLLLEDYERRPGSSIQAVQIAIMQMGHAAQDIIPNNMDVIRNMYMREQTPHMPAQTQPRDFLEQNPSGTQNSCSCPSCLTPGFQRQFSNDDNNSYPSGYATPSPHNRPNPSQYQANRNVNSNSTHRQRSCTYDRSYSVPEAFRHNVGPQSGGSINRSRHSSADGQSMLSQTVRNAPRNIPPGYSQTNETLQRARNISPNNPNVPSANVQQQDGSCSQNSSQNFQYSSIESFPEESNSQDCMCGNCRVASDPNETRVLRLESDRKSPCRLEPGSLLSDRFQEFNFIGPCDSEIGSVSDSEETELKTLDLEPSPATVDNIEIFCSNGDHRKGSQEESCLACRKNNESRISRNSWHGETKTGMASVSCKSVSDVSLEVGSAENRHSYASSTNRSGDEVIYQRTAAAQSTVSIQPSKETFGNQYRSFSGGQHPSSVGYHSNQQHRTQDQHFESNVIVIENDLNSEPNNLMPNNIPLNEPASNSQNNSQPVSRGSRSQNTSVNGQNFHLPTSHQISQSNSKVGRPQTSPDSDGPRVQGNKPKQIQVFVTYGYNSLVQESKAHLKEVKSLCQKLGQAGIKVKIDMDPQSYREIQTNSLDFIEREMDRSQYIIVCLSPTYFADIKDPSTNQNGSIPTTTQLNTRYIYDKLRAEYYYNQAQNVRVIPVLFPNSGARRDHIPSCMSSTLVYTFPEYIQKVIQRILNKPPSAYDLPYCDQ